MNAKQEAKLNMYRATEQHCDENSSIISQTPAFQTAFTTFKGKITDIIGTTSLTETALQGITVNKKTSKQDLCQLAADTASVIYAFASVNKNETLKAEVNYSYSALYKSKDDELAPRCQIIATRARENETELLPFGIKDADIEALELAIASYSQDAPKPRTALSQRKTQRANLKTLFAEADAILKDQMDKLVVTFRANNPDFVSTYFNTRTIVDPATTTTELRGTITDNSNATAINNATVEIVELTKSTTSNSVGYYQFKPVPFGTYTVRVVKTGFQDALFEDVELKLGEINRLDVLLNQ